MMRATWRWCWTIGVLLGLGTIQARAQQAPIARFTWSCDTARTAAGFACSFSGAGTTWSAPHTMTDPRRWEFGDGDTAINRTTATHTYRLASSYRVLYRACQAGVCDDTVQTVPVGTVTTPVPISPAFPVQPSSILVGRMLSGYMRFLDIPTQDSLRKLVLGYAGHVLSRTRASQLVNGTGVPLDSIERRAIGMTLAWRYRLLNDTSGPAWVQAAWQDAERERVRRGLP